MYLATQKDNIKFIVSDKPYFEFEYLQALARRGNIKKAIKDARDEYLGCVLLNEEPAYSWTAVNGGLYQPNVLRCSTKFFANPKYAGKTPFSVFKKMCQYGTQIFKNYDEADFKRFNFYFISRHPGSNPIKKLYQEIGWIVDDPHLYLVGRHEGKESAWRHIYYSGDISGFKVPRMTIEEYHKKFGEYKFNRNWSDSAITNTKFLFENNPHDKVLEIGTFEGRYTLWLADNYTSNIHTMDPYDSGVYKISQEIFDQVEQNWNYNLSICKYKDRITFYKDYSFKILSKLIDKDETFDFVYVDGFHKASTVLEDLTLSFKLLNHRGIMLIDDAVDWQARDYNTNAIINDATLTPKLAVDSFVQIYKNSIEVLQLPRQNQVAIRKIK